MQIGSLAGKIFGDRKPCAVDDVNDDADDVMLRQDMLQNQKMKKMVKIK